MYKDISKIIINALFFLMYLLFLLPAFACSLDLSLTPEKKEKKKKPSGLAPAVSDYMSPGAFLHTLKMTKTESVGCPRSLLTPAKPPALPHCNGTLPSEAWTAS